jgi:hypothetical protein
MPPLIISNHISGVREWIIHIILLVADGNIVESVLIWAPSPQSSPSDVRERRH